MSLYNRDYMRDTPHRPLGGGLSTWSVVTRLILLNVVVYVVNNLLFADPRRQFLGLSIEAIRSFQVWTPLTYQFIHANLWHLIANLVGLYFLGRMLLRLVSPRHFLSIYLLGGLVGGALQLVWNAISGVDAIVVGASGSVLAVAFALITLTPYYRFQLLLFFLIPVNLTLRQLGWVLIAVNAVLLVYPGQNPGGDRTAVMDHFGGMLLGWAYIRFGWHQRWSTVSHRSHRRRGPVIREKRVPRPARSAFPANPAARPPQGSQASFPSPVPAKKPFIGNEVDAILDKINEQGFHSLTDAERLILKQSSQELARRRDRKS